MQIYRDRLVVAWDSGWERRLTVNGHKESYWGDKMF